MTGQAGVLIKSKEEEETVKEEKEKRDMKNGSEERERRDETMRESSDTSRRQKIRGKRGMG